MFVFFLFRLLPNSIIPSQDEIYECVTTLCPYVYCVVYMCVWVCMCLCFVSVFCCFTFICYECIFVFIGCFFVVLLNFSHRFFFHFYAFERFFALFHLTLHFLLLLPFLCTVCVIIYAFSSREESGLSDDTRAPPPHTHTRARVHSFPQLSRQSLLSVVPYPLLRN